MKRAVIIGGFATGKRLLEPVGHAVCAAGLVEDAEVFTFKRTMRDGSIPMLDNAVKEALLITHSAGIMAVDPGMQPELTLAYNGPEPRSIGRLVLSALVKSHHHLIDAVEGPNRRRHLRILASNTAHFIPDLQYLKEISRFSTAQTLYAMNGAGLTVKSISTDADEFFKDIEFNRWQANIGRHIIPGGHDELLVNPEKVIAKTIPSL